MSYAQFFVFICNFYTFFCFQVEKKRQEDAANGVKIAKDLEGYVERKVFSNRWRL